MNYDITLQEETHTIGGADYVLREADEEAAIRYRNTSMRAYKLQDSKLVGFNGGAEIQVDLLSACLLKDGAAVPATVIRKWPSRVTKALFDRAKEISGLVEKAQTPAQVRERIAELQTQLENSPKNSQDGTSDTSS